MGISLNYSDRADHSANLLGSGYALPLKTDEYTYIRVGIYLYAYINSEPPGGAAGLTCGLIYVSLSFQSYHLPGLDV